MVTLRERLHQAMPDLHAALERSWAIAHDEWLPALGPSQDSYNSCPHLRNLERHLERVVAEYEAVHGATSQLLSPFETYVMLAAILFHDIGRAQREGDHGKNSQRILQRQYPSLGIPNKALADSLGRIARFHSLSSTECQDWLRAGMLRTTSISPHGEVRERVCAALLLLIDHLDGAFTRVVPVYVGDERDTGVKGAFRRAVQGVDVDLRARMVKVVLSPGLKEDEQASASGPERDPIEGFNLRPPRDHAQAKPAAADPSTFFDPLFEALNLRPGPAHARLRKVAQGRLQAARNPKASPHSWPRELLLAILMGNTRENTEALEPVRSILAAVGVPVNAWLMEVDEHLYNWWGRETYEPIFNRGYLERVARSMWDLSVRVFAHGAFSYETLAAQVGEPDCERVRRAVWRLSITCTKQRESAWHCPFWVGREQWRWNVTPREEGGTHCDYVSLAGVGHVLGELQSPDGENE